MKESIYKLLPREKPTQEKVTSYTSEFKSEVVKEAKKDRYPCKTIGPAEVVVPTPHSFLRKHHRDATGPDVSRHPSNFVKASHTRSYRDCCLNGRRPALPPNVYPLATHTHSPRDFVKFNKRVAQELVPRKPKRWIVDAKNGNKQCLDSSGLNAAYVLKKEFGEVPQYLRVRKEAVEQAIQKYSECMQDIQKKNAFHLIGPEEKEALLSGLKRQWKIRFQQYQSLPVMIDTLPKMQLKLWLEKVLADLERDIELLESFHAIYVSH